MWLKHVEITGLEALRGASASKCWSAGATHAVLPSCILKPAPLGIDDVECNCILRDERLTSDLFNSLDSTMSPTGSGSDVTPHHADIRVTLR